MSAVVLTAREDPPADHRSEARSLAVLIVDDDRPVRESLRFLLAGEGMAVSVAADGGEAAQRLAEQRFDVVITDLSMRGGGRRWIEYVRSVHPDAAVIVITASDLETGAAQKLRDAGYPVLAKPVPATDLLDALARAMRGMQDPE